MRSIVCKQCGSNNLIAEQYIYVCQNCGTKHVLDIEERAINYYKLAVDSYSADNYKDAEEFCNQALSINSYYPDALLLKGKCVGWQSSIGKLRFREAAVYFAEAIEYCPENVDEMNDEIQFEFRKLASSLMSLRCDRFQKWPDEEETSGFYNDLKDVTTAVSLYSSKTGKKIDKNKVFGQVSFDVHICMMLASAGMIKEYKSKWTERAYIELVNKTNRCIKIMEKTIDLCDDDDKSDIELYKQIIQMIEVLFALNSTDRYKNKWGAYVEYQYLSDSQQTTYKKKVEDCKNKIKKIS